MARIIDGQAMNLVGSRVRTLLETLAIYVCRGSISRIEDKRRTVTDIELYGLAKVLQVPIESLFEFPDA